MPRFTVPKFIEREAKIVGPFTFKQFVFVGIAGGISVVLYFTPIPFYFFLFATVLLFSGALVLALVKIEGRPIPVLFKNFLSFLFAEKIYLWKRKTLAPKVIKKPRPEKKEKERTPIPRIIKKSRLKDLLTRVTTGGK
jgi:hypothetical protein